MDGAYGRHGRRETRTKFWLENMKGRDHLGKKIFPDGRMNIKMDLT
jgi:hypothetical protein